MNDYEEIKARLTASIKNPISKLEGTFTMDNIQSVSQELSRMYHMDIDTIPDKILLDTAENEYLDRCVSEYGIVRNPATYAIGFVTFIGAINTYIPSNTVVVSDSLKFMTLSDLIINGTGKSSVMAQCLIAGKIGNVAISEIKDFDQDYRISGVTVINETAFTGGLDQEDDEALRQRTFEKIRKPHTSGNENDYVKWAKEVPGIGNAVCVPCWKGPGTVEVIVLASDGDVPADNILVNVVNHIEENRPIGADVTVVKAIAKDLSINGTIKMQNGYEIEEIMSGFKSLLNEYLISKPFGIDKVFSYFKVSDLLFNIDGVDDVLSYTVNDKQEQIKASAEEFFKIKEVVLNAV